MHGDSAILISRDPSPERRLWASVLMRALDDAIGLAEGIYWRLEMNRALNWIGSKDFREVCSLAGVEPDAVSERFRAEKYRANRIEQFAEVGPSLKRRGLL